jgi:hypothetical protein
MTRDSFLKLLEHWLEGNGQLRLLILKGALGNCVFTGDFEAMVQTIDEFVAECSSSQNVTEKGSISGNQ